MRGRGTVATVALAVVLAACNGSADPAPGLSPVPSPHEGVPRPSTAEVLAEREPGGPFGGEQSRYRVPGSSFAQVVAWYDGLMPDGQPWGDQWAWCEGSRRDTMVQKTYSRGDSGILTVVITADDPPGLFIGTEESGPC